MAHRRRRRQRRGKISDSTPATPGTGATDTSSAERQCSNEGESNSDSGGGDD